MASQNVKELLEEIKGEFNRLIKFLEARIGYKESKDIKKLKNLFHISPVAKPLASKSNPTPTIN